MHLSSVPYLLICLQINENLLRLEKKKIEINSFFFSPPNTCVFTTRAVLLTRTYLSSPQKEGFLLGDVKGEAKNSITDSQMDDVEVVYTIGQCNTPLTAPGVRARMATCSC